MPDLAAEAALVHRLHEVAPLASLVHDAAEGGLAVALAEAALASGIGAELELDGEVLTLFGEGGGQAVLAVAPEHVARIVDGPVPIRELGRVGGGSLLGHPLDRLRAAYEGTLPGALG
jgi:phosphoribosylformylglycinamidine synthase